MCSRVQYKMTEEEFQDLIVNACRSVPCIMVGDSVPSSPQENANRAWEALGSKLGFDFMTVEPISGAGPRFFTAIPVPREQKKDKEKRKINEERLKQVEALRLDLSKFKMS
ncbi:MAG: hypothetical protein ACTSQA_00605 [Candidatus Heimdallarchaeaceae archaeon]